MDNSDIIDKHLNPYESDSIDSNILQQLINKENLCIPNSINKLNMLFYDTYTQKLKENNNCKQLHSASSLLINNMQEKSHLSLKKTKFKLKNINCNKDVSLLQINNEDSEKTSGFFDYQLEALQIKIQTHTTKIIKTYKILDRLIKCKKFKNYMSNTEFPEFKKFILKHKFLKYHPCHKEINKEYGHTLFNEQLPSETQVNQGNPFNDEDIEHYDYPVDLIGENDLTYNSIINDAENNQNFNQIQQWFHDLIVNQNVNNTLTNPSILHNNEAHYYNFDENNTDNIDNSHGSALSNNNSDDVNSYDNPSVNDDDSEGS